MAVRLTPSLERDLIRRGAVLRLAELEREIVALRALLKRSARSNGSNGAAAAAPAALPKKRDGRKQWTAAHRKAHARAMRLMWRERRKREKSAAAAKA